MNTINQGASSGEGRAWTPGPWLWVGDDEIEQAEHPFTSVAEVVSLPRSVDPERAQASANARLISASPDLFEALAAIQALADGDDGIPPHVLIELNRKAKAALAKATGR